MVGFNDLEGVCLPKRFCDSPGYKKAIAESYDKDMIVHMKQKRSGCCAAAAKGRVLTE